MGIYGKQRFSLGQTEQISFHLRQRNSILWDTELNMARMCSDIPAPALNMGVMRLCHDFP